MNETENFTQASIFSGIGGFDLAAEWMGWDNIFYCEKDLFCNKVLAYHFPKSIAHNDIKTTDFRIYRGKIDVLTGGFPCQPYSLAGERKGTEDERHLWPEMFRAVREIQPRWIVGENVPGLLSWSRGLVFEQVCADLENEGYQVQPVVLPACGVEAPHQRDRIWFVAFKDSNENGRRSNEWKKKSNARGLRNITTRNIQQLYANDEETLSEWLDTNPSDTRFENMRRQEECSDRSRTVANSNSIRSNRRSGTSYRNEENTAERSTIQLETYKPCSKWIAAHSQRTRLESGKRCGHQQKNTELERSCKTPHVTNSQRSGWRKILQNIQSKQSDGNQFNGIGICRDRYQIPDWESFPTQSPICSRNDGFSDRLDSVAVFKGLRVNKKTIAFNKWRCESVKAFGNAVVPQLPYKIYQAIQETELSLKNNNQ